MEASLLPGLSAEEIARSRRPLEDAWTLPAAAYVRQDIHALETERILRRSWTPLARVDQVPEPGDFIAMDLAGQPVLLAQTGRSCGFWVMIRSPEAIHSIAARHTRRTPNTA